MKGNRALAKITNIHICCTSKRQYNVEHMMENISCGVMEVL